MKDYEPSTYGDRIAHIYDELYREADPSRAVALLVSLAGDGPVLELAIGTGRVALPLHEAGLEVHGIEASPEMVARLPDKPGGPEIPVAMGDFADVAVDDRYTLIYVVFNTFFALLTQDDQVRCFQRVAERLSPGGRFVIEAFVPDLTRFDRGQRTYVTSIDDDSVTLDVALHEQVTQRTDSQKIIITGDSIEMLPVSIRHAYPSELDLMARIGGLELEHRWQDWEHRPFTSKSENHVSVYRKP